MKGRIQQGRRAEKFCIYVALLFIDVGSGRPEVKPSTPEPLPGRLKELSEIARPAIAPKIAPPILYSANAAPIPPVTKSAGRTWESS